MNYKSSLVCSYFTYTYGGFKRVLTFNSRVKFGNVTGQLLTMG